MYYCTIHIQPGLHKFSICVSFWKYVDLPRVVDKDMGFFVAIVQIFMILVARAFRFLSPRAWRHDLLEVKIDGELPEELPQAGFVRRLIRTRLTFRDYLLMLREAKDDPHLNAVIFHIRDPHIGWARAWELREIIKELRHAGLSTTAFLESADNRSYYIAAACDEIFLVPTGQVRIRGLTGEVMFLKKALEKLKVKAELSHAGKYKSAHEIFTRTGMSPAHREEINDILDNLFGHWIGELSDDRHIGEKRMKTLVDRGTFLAADAKKAGLVDGLCYYDEIEEVYEERLCRKPRSTKLVRYSAYRAVDHPISQHFKTRPRIAVVYATGPITTGSSSDFAPTGRSTGADSVAESLREAGKDRNVAGILVRVSSPGGSALASDLIWREMEQSAKKGNPDEERNQKPVMVSMGDVAASGGYYIASAADKILAGPSTITGSIGVIGGKFNLGGLAETVGVKVETVTRGKTADMESAFRAYSPAEKKHVQSEIKTIYKDFIDRVSTGRSLSTRKVQNMAQGRVWLGTQAKNKGLIDDIGGFLAALDEVKQSAGISIADRVMLDIYPKRKRVLRVPFRGISSADRIRNYVSETVLSLLPDEFREFVPLWREEGPLAIIPYFLKIR